MMKIYIYTHWDFDQNGKLEGKKRLTVSEKSSRERLDTVEWLLFGWLSWWWWCWWWLRCCDCWCCCCCWWMWWWFMVSLVGDIFVKEIILTDSLADWLTDCLIEFRYKKVNLKRNTKAHTHNNNLWNIYGVTKCQNIYLFMLQFSNNAQHPIKLEYRGKCWQHQNTKEIKFIFW